MTTTTQSQQVGRRREFVATVNTKAGTQAVTIVAFSEKEARNRLAKMGYMTVLAIG